jgi:GNAT superfamily N-acetyltransferase
MTSPLQIQRVVSNSDRRDLLAFPYRLYRGDRAWVPRLWPEQAGWLNRQPGFFDHGDGEWFLARRGGDVVGTIGAGVDHRENELLGRRRGVFGFFEFVHDEEVFRALVDQARAWLHVRGLTEMAGPQSFGGSDYPGFLVGRFDLPAALYEGHSPPYYLEFAERAGWKKTVDSLAYRASRTLVAGKPGELPPKVLHVADRVARNPRFSLRPADFSHFEREFQAVLRIYNRSLGTLPGFAPVGEDEFRRFVRDLMPVLREDLVIFALVDGREVGFSLALPNVAEALMASGGLRWPWQAPLLWLALRRIKSVSFKILALDPDYWGLGLDALMFARMIEACLRLGFEWADLSLTGEDNPQTNKLALRLGAEEYKRYRTFLVEI